MRFMLVAVMLASVAVGCAKRPDAIVPVNIPMAAYQNLSCAQLAQEYQNEQQKLASLSKQQNKAASKDAWGVFLIGAPIGTMVGDDQEGNLAVSKGKLQALENSMKSRGC